MSRTDKDIPARFRFGDRDVRTRLINPEINYSSRIRTVPGHDDLVAWSPSTGIPRWFVNHRGTAPDRLRARIACDAIRHDWNTWGDTDLEYPTDQHRHGARWDWT